MRELRGGFQETVGRKSGDSEKKRGHRDGVGTVAPSHRPPLPSGELPVATKPTKSTMADFKARWQSAVAIAAGIHMTTEEPIQPAESSSGTFMRCEKCGGMAKFARCRPDAFSRGLEM